MNDIESGYKLYITAQEIFHPVTVNFHFTTPTTLGPTTTKLTERMVVKELKLNKLMNYFIDTMNHRNCPSQRPRNGGVRLS